MLLIVTRNVTKCGRLLNQTAIIGRLFYLTARLLLCKTHPFESGYSPEMRNLQQGHAHSICGIIAQLKDWYVRLSRRSDKSKLTVFYSGVASFSIRFLAFAAECLSTRESQEEALQILDRLLNQTSWQPDSIKIKLQEAWAWNSQPATSADSASLMNEHHTMLKPSMSFPEQPKMPCGVINPTLLTADFSMENHPYRGFYISPHSQHFIDEFQFGSF